MNRHFKTNMRKIQIAISSDLCIRLTWNLTGSCGQQQRLRRWSCMVVKQFQDGGRPPFWKLIYRHLSEKSSDFDEILYTAADFELDERHMIKNEKLHWTESEFDRTYFLLVLYYQLCCWLYTLMLIKSSLSYNYRVCGYVLCVNSFLSVCCLLNRIQDFDCAKAVCWSHVTNCLFYYTISTLLHVAQS